MPPYPHTLSRAMPVPSQAALLSGAPWCPTVPARSSSDIGPGPFAVGVGLSTADQRCLGDRERQAQGKQHGPGAVAVRAAVGAGVVVAVAWAGRASEVRSRARAAARARFLITDARDSASSTSDVQESAGVSSLRGRRSPGKRSFGPSVASGCPAAERGELPEVLVLLSRSPAPSSPARAADRQEYWCCARTSD